MTLSQGYFIYSYDLKIGNLAPIYARISLPLYYPSHHIVTYIFLYADIRNSIVYQLEQNMSFVRVRTRCPLSIP